MTDGVPAEWLEALTPAYRAWRHSTLGRITDALEELLLIEKIGAVEGLRILDVGCGDGVLATRLASLGAGMTGLDANKVMLDAARERTRQAGVLLELVQGDAEHLPFDDRSFDVIVSVAALCFSRNPALSLKQMARCLKPGGKLVLGELANWNLWAAQRRIKGWLGSSLWQSVQFRTSRELYGLVEQAGFQDGEITGAIYYPPLAVAARLLEPFDRRIGQVTTTGAAFLLLTARQGCGGAASPSGGTQIC